MENLTIHNPHFITYQSDLLTIDVMGGIDLIQVQRMVATLRITYENYPPYRTTLDLYNDHQTHTLVRVLCDKWKIKLTEVAKPFHEMIFQLEEYRLQELRYKGKASKPHFHLEAKDKQEAIAVLQSENLMSILVKKLNTTGIIGEDTNATILFLALASYRYSNPFSVLCLSKDRMGKSYLLQQLVQCMPIGSYSFHNRISSNALYYFDSSQIQQKALLIEDVEWTSQMLNPLATLKTQGRLISTRTTKNKDGMYQSTTFEVEGNLCMVACTYQDKNYEQLSLPFLVVHLQYSSQQEEVMMEYQRRVSAGLINESEIFKTQHQLKCLIASLKNIRVINPYATAISLPKDIAYPKKTLLLLLDFIEVITYFFQYQREQKVDEETGELYIETHPDDITLAFDLLKDALFRCADELSASVRKFYTWLTEFLIQQDVKEFTGLDIRKAKSIHPRSLNRYLQELKLYNYIKVVGGNKHRGGYRYELLEFGNQNDKQQRIEISLQNTLKRIRKLSVGQ